VDFGKLVRLTKHALKKTLDRSFVTLQVLETIVVEVEATLNDRYVSSDVTSLHLLHGKQMVSLPHSYDDPEEPDYVVSELQVKKQLTSHARLLQHSSFRPEHTEY